MAQMDEVHDSGTGSIRVGADSLHDKSIQNKHTLHIKAKHLAIAG